MEAGAEGGRKGWGRDFLPVGEKAVSGKPMGGERRRSNYDFWSTAVSLVAIL